MKKSGIANASVHDASGIALSNTSIFPSLIAPAVNYAKMPHAPTFRLGGAGSARARTRMTTTRNALMAASLVEFTGYYIPRQQSRPSRRLCGRA